MNLMPMNSQRSTSEYLYFDNLHYAELKRITI